MRKHAVAGLVCSLLFATPLLAQQGTLLDPGPEHHLIYPAADIEWRPGPASFEPGAEMSLLEGNPGEPGVFTMQLRLPHGFRIAPHWHPNVERVTVLSGTFRLGSGETLDPAATTALEPGSYVSLPPRTPHYAIAEGQTVIQLTTVGPWQINYVRAEDDPRRRD